MKLETEVSSFMIVINNSILILMWYFTIYESFSYILVDWIIIAPTTSQNRLNKKV